MDSNKEEETEASLDSDYDIDEYKLDEQLVDTDSDQQSNEQVIQKKNINDIHLEYKIFTNQFDEIVKQIQAGEKNEIPKHGTLAKIRQHIPAERMAGFQSIDESSEPVWLKRNGEAE